MRYVLSTAEEIRTRAIDGITIADTVTVRVAKNQLSGLSSSDLEVVPVVESEATGSFRAVEVEGGQYVFSGAKERVVENAPRTIDLLLPSDVSQSDVVAYDETSGAILPFTPL